MEKIKSYLYGMAWTMLIVAGLIVIYSIKAGDKFDWMVCGVYGGSVACFLLGLANKYKENDNTKTKN